MLCMAGIGLALIQNSARREGRVDPVTHAIRTVISPGAEISANVASSAKRTLDGWSAGPSLQEENQELKAQVASLQLYAADSVLLKAELDQIKLLSNIAVPPERKLIQAKVVGFWPVENRLSLNVGKKQGIRPDLAVIAPDGLAGVVESVEERSCQVLLLSSPSVRIGAMVARPTPSFGLLRGLKIDELTMEVPGSAPVEVNDKVLTSGLSDVIPGGIVIGEVTAIAAQVGYGTRQLTVFPRYRITPGQRLVVVR